MTYKLPKLPYDFNALEPYIDTRTMTVHYRMHHAGYVKNLNKTLEGYPDLQDKSIYELLLDLDKLPEEIQVPVRNFGGGHANHSFFWPSLTPKIDGSPSGSLADLINSGYGSVDGFKEQFTKSAMSLFGSGWTWLCVDADGKAVIINTPNQDNPIYSGLFPLVGLDLWEHAYYLNYENKRNDYIAAWWHIVNWDYVSKNYITFQTQVTMDQVSSTVKGFINKLGSSLSGLVGSDD